MNRYARRRRPMYCPRCGSATETMRMEMVQKPEEQTVEFVEDPDVMPEPMSFETEEWVKYLPCGHVVPPEEHEELVSPTTPHDFTALF